MASDLAEPVAPTRRSDPIPVKIVVAGGFGVGKTTFVGAVSEIMPLSTEALMTDRSTAVDDTHLLPDKQTTTVALDFGRLTIDDGMTLYLFGTPGQDRFWFMWDDLTRGAVGAVVLADIRRINHCFAAIDYFEARDLPFVVAVNVFETIHWSDAEIRDALQLGPDTPLVRCDARDQESATATLIALVVHALEHSARAGARR